MNELSSASDLSTTNLLTEQFDSNFNQSINGTSSAIKNLFQISPETRRIFYITIAIIIVLICLTILIYICLRRYVELAFVFHYLFIHWFVRKSYEWMIGWSCSLFTLTIDSEIWSLLSLNDRPLVNFKSGIWLMNFQLFSCWLSDEKILSLGNRSYWLDTNMRRCWKQRRHDDQYWHHSHRRHR